MIHPNKTELEQFVSGKLAAARLLEVDEHINECSECRDAVNALPANKRTALDLGAMLLGAKDCPEYEQLSAYVDDELDSVQTSNIEAHVNLCELCTRDVSRIAELRSHASLRSVITVSPGMSPQSQRVAVPIWKRVFAGACAAAIVAVGMFSLGSVLNHKTGTAGVVAKGPVINGARSENAKPSVAQETDNTRVAINDSGSVKPIPSVPNKPDQQAPKPETLLHDGTYQVIKQNGEMVLAKAGSPRTALEARIAESINEKLRTGKIKPERPVRLALATIGTRGPSPLAPSAVAPKPIAPFGKMLMTNRPTLRWSKVDLADSYQVLVKSKSGDIVANEITDGTSLTLTKPLVRGEVYSWLVGVRFGKTDKWEQSAPVMFAVLSDRDYDSIQKLQREMPGSHLALGAAYEFFGLTDEAHSQYAAVRSANHGSPLARKLH